MNHKVAYQWHHWVELSGIFDTTGWKVSGVNDAAKLKFFSVLRTRHSHGHGHRDGHGHGHRHGQWHRHRHGHELWNRHSHWLRLGLGYGLWIRDGHVLVMQSWDRTICISVLIPPFISWNVTIIMISLNQFRWRSLVFLVRVPWLLEYIWYINVENCWHDLQCFYSKLLLLNCLFKNKINLNQMSPKYFIYWYTWPVRQIKLELSILIGSKDICSRKFASGGSTLKLRAVFIKCLGEQLCL